LEFPREKNTHPFLEMFATVNGTLEGEERKKELAEFIKDLNTPTKSNADSRLLALLATDCLHNTVVMYNVDKTLQTLLREHEVTTVNTNAELPHLNIVYYFNQFDPLCPLTPEEEAAEAADAAAQELRDRIKQLEEENADLRRRLLELGVSLDDITPDMEEEAKRLKEEIEKLSEEIDYCQDQFERAVLRDKQTVLMDQLCRNPFFVQEVAAAQKKKEEEDKILNEEALERVLASAEYQIRRELPPFNRPLALLDMEEDDMRRIHQADLRRMLDVRRLTLDEMRAIAAVLPNFHNKDKDKHGHILNFKQRIDEMEANLKKRLEMRNGRGAPDPEEDD